MSLMLLLRSATGQGTQVSPLNVSSSPVPSAPGESGSGGCRFCSAGAHSGRRFLPFSLLAGRGTAQITGCCGGTQGSGPTLLK